MGKKRILSLLMVSILVVSLCACSKQAPISNPGNGGVTDTQGAGQTTDGNVTDDGGNTTGVVAQGEMAPGTLNFLALDDRDPSVLRGIRLTGNRAGSGEDAGFNNKKAGTADIRCIFELNEYVGVYPDTDLSEGISVWVFEHKDDQTVYQTADSVDGIPGLVLTADLVKSEDNPDWEWASFCLNPEDYSTGYYDIVFVNEGKVIATLLTYFYDMGALEGKTDAELDQLIKDIQ